MIVVIAGGSGFLGATLARELHAAGHHIRILTRRPRPDHPEDVAWTPDGTAGPWAETLDGADAVVNLSGAGIADRRWSDKYKATLRESRVRSTRSLVAGIRAAIVKPPAFVSGSAVGFYGPRGDERVTEDTPPGTDFLSRLAAEWEMEARAAEEDGVRVALVRTGLVLHPEGGALGKMLLPFKLGVAGTLGSGDQYMPWIHRRDWTRLVRWLVEEPRAAGAYNGSAPQPVTNREFTKTMGRVLNRPTVLPAPAFALRAALGELADTLLTGQNAIPTRAQALGFQFEFRELEPALRDLLA